MRCAVRCGAVWCGVWCGGRRSCEACNSLVWRSNCVPPLCTAASRLRRSRNKSTVWPCSCWMPARPLATGAGGSNCSLAGSGCRRTAGSSSPRSFPRLRQASSVLTPPDAAVNQVERPHDGGNRALAGADCRRMAESSGSRPCPRLWPSPSVLTHPEAAADHVAKGPMGQMDQEAKAPMGSGTKGPSGQDVKGPRPNRPTGPATMKGSRKRGIKHLSKCID